MAIYDRPIEPGERSGALDQLRMALPGLTPAEARIAERILHDPGSAVTLTISELAAACQVSQPTVSRLCRSVGFPSYAALRIGIVNDHAAAPRGLPDADRSLQSQLETRVDAFAGDGTARAAASAIRGAPRVEIWPSFGLMPTACRLADRLAALDVPASAAILAGGWSSRAAALPPGSIVVVMTDQDEGASLSTAAGLARDAGARILYCTSRAEQAVLRLTEWALPFPSLDPPELAAYVLVEALTRSVRRIDPYGGPAGPASPWRPWPHQRRLYLPATPEPLPAILLSHEEPASPRPLLIYSGGFEQTKEMGVPGTGSNDARLVSALLNGGFHVLLVDAPAHGERRRGWEDTATLVRASLNGQGPDLLSFPTRQARELVDGAISLGVTQSPPSIAVAGTSWGGLQALLTLAGDPRVRCAVMIASIYQVGRLPALAGLGVTAPGLGASVSATLASRPLMLIGGEKDPLSPPGDAQAFTDSAFPARGPGSGRVHHVVVPGVGHEWHPVFAEQAVSWLRAQLLTSEAK